MWNIVSASCILSFIYGYPFEETEDIELTLQKIYEAKILESDLSCAVLTIQLHRLTFLPGTVIAEEYYNELEFEGINTMSYFDEDVEIPLEIRELMLQNKTGFLNLVILFAYGSTYIIFDTEKQLTWCFNIFRN